MAFGFDEVARDAAKKVVNRRNESDRAAAEMWARRKALTMQFTEQLKPLLQSLYRRLTAENVPRVQTGFRQQGILKRYEQVYSLTDSPDMSLDGSFGRAAPEIRYITADGAFYSVLRITAPRRISAPTAAPGDALGRSQVFEHPIIPPRGLKPGISSGHFDWVSKRDSLELSLYRICGTIVPFELDSFFRKSPFVGRYAIDTKTGRAFVLWNDTNYAAGSDYLPPADMRVPEIVPSVAEPLEEYIARLGARLIYSHMKK